MLEARVWVTLRVKAPVLTRASFPGVAGLDAVFARNPEGTHLALPDTLVKGRARDAWVQLCAVGQAGWSTNDVSKMFGREAADEASLRLAPHPGALDFGAFMTPMPDRGLHITRIAIDDDRQATVDGAMQLIEEPWPPGTVVTFEGPVDFVASDLKSANVIRKRVVRACWLMGQVGAFASVGFGEIVDVTGTLREASPVGRPAEADASCAPLDCLAITLTPSGPMCVPRALEPGNLFESDDVVEGRRLKGALAETINRLQGRETWPPLGSRRKSVWPTIEKYFHLLRFGHALPAHAGARPVTPPLSLVKAGQSLQDAARRAPGDLLIGDVAPEFAVDWKDAEPVNRRFGLARPSRWVTVHTAIDANTRSAQSGQLFSVESVLPWKWDSDATGQRQQRPIQWHGFVDLSDVPEAERAAAVSELRHVLGKRIRIGRTRCSVSFELGDGLPVSSVKSNCRQAQVFDDKGTLVEGWVVSLQTPSYLAELNELSESSTADDLLMCYRKAFARLSAGTLHLVRFFARQELAGGDYWHRRFGSEGYRPKVLTEAGSVFVLVPASDGNGGQATIQRWLTHGLGDLEPASLEGVLADPFARQNGFGEIAVNLPVLDEAQR